jgi:hypothetical protein
MVMRKYHWLVMILAVFFSCKKETTENPPLHGPSFIDLKLKDITIRNLPSPYYHFEYGNNNRISAFNFSQVWTYDMSYSGNDLNLMKGNTSSVNQDSVSYVYDRGTVTNILVSSSTGTLYRKATLTYHPSGQLHTVEWEIKLVNEPFKPENSLTFTYHDDGNVREIVHHYFPLNGIPDVTFTDTYSNYDNKDCPEGFTLVHTSQFKHAILLPGLTLQRNNAGRIVRTGGAAVNFEVNYQFTYDNTGRPLTKTGDFVATTGPDAGKHVELFTSYSYYN